MKNYFRTILFALTAYSLLILRYGYSFGRLDQSEILPYALFLGDNTLYPYDLFIRGLHSFIPNERIVIAGFLYCFRNCLQPAVFIIHFLTTLILIAGIEKLFMKFIANRIIAWLSTIFCLVILYMKMPGENDVYAPYFAAGNLASAAGIWALNYFLDNKYLIMTMLLIVATFIQPVVGLQLMIIASAILLLNNLKGKAGFLKNFLLPVLLYSLTALIYIIFIKIEYDSFPGTISDKEYFDIMFRFRHPHHYIPSSFSYAKYAVLVFLLIPSLFFFYKKNFNVFLFIAIALACCVVYTIAVELFSNVFIANFQWFSILAWLKIYGCIAWAAYIEKIIPVNIAVRGKTEILFMALIIASSWVLVSGFKKYIPWICYYDFGNQATEDPVADICKQIATKTPKDALFIHPFGITELKYYGMRSSYVEFKAIVRQKGMAEKWYKRVQDVYGISLSSEKRGFALNDEADRHFFSLLPDVLSKLKKDGVTHILTLASGNEPIDNSGLKLIAQNGFYKVYALNK